MSEMNGRQKIRTLYQFISENLYFNRPDIEIEDEQFNSTLLFSLLTALVGGKALLIGEPGLGKTTSAEYVCALFYRYPLGVIWGSEIAGHPEQTEEKIIGRPDLGRLNLGEEAVVWSSFTQLPIKIVDEINRLPETKQSLILDGVDRGNWEYLNDYLINEEYCLFATANYQDPGTNTVIPPLLDRFDLIMESKHPGANISFLIGQRAKKDEMLRDARYEEEIMKILGSRAAIKEKWSKLEEICRGFGQQLHDRYGIESLSTEERQAMREEIGLQEFSLEASAFLRMALAELSFCCKYGQKRSNEECDEGCHYSGYLCYQVKNCASNRLPISIRKYAQALSWLAGAPRVDVEHVRHILPGAIAHRVQWRDSYISAKERESRRDPLLIHLARQATSEIFRRFHEQQEEVMQALAIAAHILEGADLKPMDGDHPIYVEIKRDLGSDERW
ncbi:MAG: AAA family ATPase [Candidatus Tectomicrobia bacterium]|nr:AAA family ATPase [Candidatus Tectomicrobia bacterium]